MKTAVSLPDEVFFAADALAKRRGTSRSRLYADALREYVSRNDANTVTQRLDAVCDELDSSLEKDLKRAARSTLERSEW